MSSSPPDDAALAGSRIGRYEIVRRIASGGMGEVFLAEATGPAGFTKSVALKRLRPELAADPAFVAMILDEARIAATLDHSNIVQVVDVLLERGTAWIVMEYLRGADVAQLVQALGARGAKFPIGAAVAIAIAVGDALHYAHERRDKSGAPLEVVHRDVSPANVIVTLDGTVKVIDFGIARANARTTQTAVGTIKGKLLYMSPEQCRGERLDRRSDVFSLGVTLFEMLTGRSPHAGADEYEIQKAIVEGTTIAPSSVEPEVPAAIDAIVARCLAKRPGARHQTAGELAAALLEVAERHRWDLSPFALARLVKAAERTPGSEDEPPHRSSVTHAPAPTRAHAASQEPAGEETTGPRTQWIEPAGGRRVAPWGIALVALASGALGIFVGRSGTSGPPQTPSPSAVATTTTPSAPVASERAPLAAAPLERAPAPSHPPEAEPPRPSASTKMPRVRSSARPSPEASAQRPPPDPDAPLPR